MMYTFLRNNRDDLIERCKAKVAQRPHRTATTVQLANGIPMFLDQLTRTLAAEDAGHIEEGLRISGEASGAVAATSEIGVSAMAHGASLLLLGYSVDQVVHDYGDLCQAITDLAFERDAPFAVDEFRTLNRCLDNAIADAVLEFSAQREMQVLERHQEESREQAGFLVHELRNALSTARLAMSALELGNMTLSGATGAVLKRSLGALELLVNRAAVEVRHGVAPERELFAVDAFIDDAHAGAQFEADAVGCRLTVGAVDATLALLANRAPLLAALANLLQNAFKFTRPYSEVVLSVRHAGDLVLIDVRDQCGGLAHGDTETLFAPFTQHGHDRTGMGLGLAIARHSVEEDFGTLTARDVPGHGCVFTMSMPLHALPPPPPP